MSLLQNIKSIYRSLPPWSTAVLKHIPNRILFGKAFVEAEPDVAVGGLNIKIKSVLDYAREHTIWGSQHIPSNIKVEEARELLLKLPCVSSSELAQNINDFVSDEATEANSYLTTTGGSGRNPTTIRLSNESYGLEWAHMLKIWEQGGYNRHKDVKLTFRGYHLRPGELVRRDPIYNEISVDPFQLNESNFDSFFKAISNQGITCLHGYPSLICMFKERLARRGLKFPVRQIMLGSEGASPQIKSDLAKFFGAKVVSWYGMTEKVTLAYDEMADGRFVNFSSYGYPRVINADENGIGEIVGTTFVNKAMPLVNYRTGDYGRIVEENGRLIIEQLQGRWGKDFVFLSKTEKIPTSAINLHGDVQSKILYYQLVQNEFAKLIVKVVPKSEQDCRVIREQIAEELGRRLKGFEIKCELVGESDLERSPRGKFIMLVQNIKI